jgi:uncharacterized protein with NRDE domain
MCVVYLGQNLSTNIKLLIASNRDEFYSRPYSTISKWDNGIIAGKDEKENGTWLGFNTKGNFAFITNYRTGLKREDIVLSRGQIVSNYLATGLLPKDADYSQYGDFNFVFGNLKEVGFISNVEGNYRSSDDSFSVSNGKLFNKWPKMNALESKIQNLDFIKSPELLMNDIFECLSDKNQASDNLLPNTGVGLEYERILSSIFISSPTYGTVSQNVSIVDRNNVLHMFERDILGKKESYIKVQLGEI